MTRALDLNLTPQSSKGCDKPLSVEAHVYAPLNPDGSRAYADMAEQVFFALNLPGGFISVSLTPDEARSLASHLIQCAGLAEEHRCRREQLDDIEEQLRDPDFDSDLVTFVHPDVVYVEPGQISAASLLHPGKVLIARQPELRP